MQEAGRVDIRQASVSDLPFAADTFNLVTAIETQYYWPDLPNDMREIFRVLKPGGTLAVIAETYRGGNRDVVIGTVMRLFGSPSLGVKEHRELFLQAGYTDVEVYEERKKGWICVTGKKGVANNQCRNGQFGNYSLPLALFSRGHRNLSYRAMHNSEVYSQ
jgi:SAM-dependent methyltransferase